MTSTASPPRAAPPALRATLGRAALALAVIGLLALVAAVALAPSAPPARRGAPAFVALGGRQDGRREPLAQRFAGAVPPALRARLTRPTALRAEPDGRSVARLGMRTEHGSPRVLGVLRTRAGWVEVAAAERPNGVPGWVPEADVRLEAVPYELRADLSARELVLLRGREELMRVPVATGRPGAATPIGRFAITDKLAVAAGSPYGCCVLALNGHQPNIPQGWTGGDRIAIHATQDASSIGKAVSLGCLRAPEAAMRRLVRDVPLGTPVVIEA